MKKNILIVEDSKAALTRLQQIIEEIDRGKTCRERGKEEDRRDAEICKGFSQEFGQILISSCA